MCCHDAACYGEQFGEAWNGALANRMRDTGHQARITPSGVQPLYGVAIGQWTVDLEKAMTFQTMALIDLLAGRP